MKIFVSYSHGDSVFVKRLCVDLRTEHEVTVDTTSLVPDVPLIQQISALIDSGDIFIPVISHASMKSVWVSRALSLAFQNSTQRGILVVPVIIDDVDPTSLISHIPYVRFIIDDTTQYMNAFEQLMNILRRSPIVSRHIVLRNFSSWGNISIQHTADYGVIVRSDGDTQGASGLVYHHPIYITGFSLIALHVEGSQESDFAGFYPHTSKMLKLQMDDRPISPLNISTDVDDPGYISAQDGDIEYAIPTSLRERGYLKKLEIVFGRGRVNGLRFVCRVA